jgi:hypothetical protein
VEEKRREKERENTGKYLKGSKLSLLLSLNFLGKKKEPKRQEFQ